MQDPSFDFNNPESRSRVQRFAPNLGGTVLKNYDDAQAAQADAKTKALAYADAQTTSMLSELFQYRDFGPAEEAVDQRVAAGQLTPEQGAAAKAKMRSYDKYDLFAADMARSKLTPAQMLEQERSQLDTGTELIDRSIPKYGRPGEGYTELGRTTKQMTLAEQAAANVAARVKLESLPADGAGVVRMVNPLTGQVVQEIQGAPTGTGGKGKGAGAGEPGGFSAKMEAARGVLTTLDTLIGPAGSDASAGIVQSGESGLLGQVMANVGGSTAFDVDSAITSVKANLGFDRLQQMRDESPTGGALGQVAVQELEALQAAVASLKVGQKTETLRGNLERVRKHYTKWLTSLEDDDALQQYAAKNKGTPRETVPRIDSQTAYNALPPGAPYRDSSGTLAFKGGN